ncbi:MAG: magnesium transporter, partial [Bdellovibrionota bacterium]
KAFEDELSAIIELAFFLPVMVYLGDAVGTQTQMLFVRGLTTETVRLSSYLRRELLVDVSIGALLSILLGAFSFFLIGEIRLTSIIMLAVFAIVSTAGLLAIGISLLLFKLRRDPAIGGGPFVTIVQDIVSLLIYFAIATAIL